MVNAAAVAAFLYLRLSNRPSLLTLQEGDNEEYVRRWLGPFFPIYPPLHRPFDRIHSISSFLARQAVGYGAAGDTISIVPNGVDTNMFNARAWSADELMELRRRLNLEGKRVIVSVSRLVPKNGLRDLIRAMPAIARRYPNTVLLLVGDGPERLQLEHSAEQLGIGERVCFAGAVSHEETARYLLLAEVFARPSISEGLGSAFLEAMACGVPVVGTPVGGIVDFLRDGETGLFCEPGDPDSLAESICRLLEKAELARHVSLQGQRQVERDYRWDSVAERMGELYDELLECEVDLMVSSRKSRSGGRS
jgi:phosphatidylinositol alpha-1,6-mannosyltransferase